MLAEILIGWAIQNQFGSSSKSSKSADHSKEIARIKAIEEDNKRLAKLESERLEMIKKREKAFADAAAAARR
ncbi:MAG: hypothetical protein V1779_17595 [bacterium]